DPSQRQEARTKITKQEVAKNIATWKKQVSKVVDLKKIRVKQNGDWLLKLRTAELLEIASHLSASQLFQRDMFQERIKRGGTVWVHEMLYPVLQGYDSVALKTDVEIGGTDQVFNMLVGRELRRKMQGEGKYVLTVPMILGLDGKTMSKSSGNTVNITDEPNDMYGKLMTLNDALVPEYFEFCTSLPMDEVAKLRKQLSPRDLKARLAKEIVSIYHGKTKAGAAEKEFSRVFKEKLQPSAIKEVNGLPKELSLADALVRLRFASSKSEARRLISQGGVRVDGAVEQNESALLRARSGTVIQVGKRRFVRLL
ncbi:MAG: tyrosine--tRNA ligase, partial [bacterium]|nr:tyrosine--tRNA ligase [bacterium]